MIKKFPVNKKHFEKLRQDFKLPETLKDSDLREKNLLKAMESPPVIAYLGQHHVVYSLPDGFYLGPKPMIICLLWSQEQGVEDQFSDEDVKSLFNFPVQKLEAELLADRQTILGASNESTPPNLA